MRLFNRFGVVKSVLPLLGLGWPLWTNTGNIVPCAWSLAFCFCSRLVSKPRLLSDSLKRSTLAVDHANLISDTQRTLFLSLFSGSRLSSLDYHLDLFLDLYIVAISFLLLATTVFLIDPWTLLGAVSRHNLALLLLPSLEFSHLCFAYDNLL